DDRDFAGEPAHGRPRCNKRSSTASTGSLFARITAYASGESHKVAKADERVLRTGAASVWIDGTPIYLPLAGGSGLLDWPASRAKGERYAQKARARLGAALGAPLHAERPCTRRPRNRALPEQHRGRPGRARPRPPGR